METDNSRLTLFQDNYTRALNAKSTIDAQIAHNIALYQGTNMNVGHDGSKYNSIVLKDVKRAVEGLLPQLIEPFVSTQEAILAEPKTYHNVQGAMLHSALLNEEFNALGKDEFIELMARTMVVEGTVFLRAGWNKGRATAYVCENGSVFTDPSAKTLKESKFLIYKRRVSKLTIKNNPMWYGEGSYNKIKDKAFDASMDGSENQVAETIKEQHGFDESFNFEEGDVRGIVTTYEYYGYDDNGEPVLAIWCEDEMLRDDKSPFPENPIPFTAKAYMLSPNSIWGDGLPQLIEDHQNVRSEIMRGVLDNMTSANNGQKFIKKGTMDYVNWKRMRNGDKYIQVNKLPSENIETDAFNPIAPSTFNLLETFQLDEESMTGVTRFTQGNDPRALNSTARGIETLSGMAHQRTLHTVRSISSSLAALMEIWAQFNVEFLDPSQVVRIRNEFVPFSTSELASELSISITVGTAGLNEAKTQSIMMMTQLAMGGAPIPPEAVNEMMASLAEINNLPSVAQKIREAADAEPSEEEQASAQKEEQVKVAVLQTNMETEKAKAAKDATQANLNNVRAEETMIDNRAKMIALNPYT